MERVALGSSVLRGNRNSRRQHTSGALEYFLDAAITAVEQVN